MFKERIQIAILFTLLAFGFSACNQGAKQAEAEEETTSSEEDMAMGSGMTDGTYVIGEGANVEWVGKKVTGQHNGVINVQNGRFMVENGDIVGGSFEMDLNSISSLDLAGDPESQAKLEGHLKSEDFFNVEASPVATFQITDVMPAEGEGTHMVKGDLTIKNITNEITFPATITEEDGTVMVKANTAIDRTLWDIKYGSGKFYEDLGDKMIYDDFEIAFDLKAPKQTM